MATKSLCCIPEADFNIVNQVYSNIKQKVLKKKKEKFSHLQTSYEGDFKS